MSHNKKIAVTYALLAAVFYALNTPFSKKLMNAVPPIFMAAFLYLGAGLGVGILFLLHGKKSESREKLTKKDFPYTIGMIVLDITAPIALMVGVHIGSASNASLLGNFEIVATTVIALLLFGEKVSVRLWSAIGLITLSSLILSFDGANGLHFSYGSLFVLFATLCWGLENNCTRKIADKSTYEIVMLKGFFSGGGAFLIAVLKGERLPLFSSAALAMLLGFFAYGLSIFLYVRAQWDLGASKTSAYYAAAPFIGAFLAFVVNGETLSKRYFAALLIMIAGTYLVVRDTLAKNE
jgi:drug/metabolite transporter (DMT)-like permease